MNRIPITLITGFLGSGKSTLINRIMEENKGKKFGLVLNEFGDVKLESNIVKAEGEGIVELSNGCMCCVVRGDLVKAVDDLMNKVPDLEYIIIEASGLSDPVPIAQTFLMQDMDKRIRLDSVLCVVDALNFENNSKNFEITLAQLRFSDIVLISKGDLVDPLKVEAIKELVKDLVPHATIFESNKDLNLDLIIDTSQYNHDRIEELEIEEHHHHGHDHHHKHDEECDDEECDHEHHEHDGKRYHHAHEHVDTLFFKTDRPMDHKKFEHLLSNLPEEIVRAKGFVNFGSGMIDTSLKYVLQVVGARRQFIVEPWSEDEERQSALVFIGKHFDEKDMLKRLKDCEI